MSPTARFAPIALLLPLALLFAEDGRSQSYIVDVETGTPGIQTATSVTVGTPSVPVEIIMLSPGPGFMATGFTSYAVATEYNDVPGILTLVPVAPGFPAAFDPSGIGISAASATPIFDILAPPPAPPIGPGAPLATLGFLPAATGAAGPFTASDGGVGVFNSPPSPFFGGPPTMPAPGTPIPLQVVTFSASAVGTSDVAPIGLYPCVPYPMCAPLVGPPPPPAAVIGPGAWPLVAELYDEMTGTPIAAVGIPPVTPGVITVTMVLPVELIAFDAVVDGQTVILTWETASETDNLGFEIQYLRPEEGPFAIDDWTVAGFAEGRGTTDRGSVYRYELNDLSFGRHFFRLKQIDLNGAVEYSEMVEMEIDLPAAFTLGDAYPNPFYSDATIALAVNRAQTVRVEVFDLAGRSIAVLHDGLVEANTEKHVRFYASDLPNGLYVYQAVGEFFKAEKAVAIVR